MSAGHHRQQHRLCDLGPALRLHPLLPLRPGRAGRRELGPLRQPEVDALIDEASKTFDVDEAGRADGAGAQPVVDEALLVWVVHDTNPHALSECRSRPPRVR